MHYFREPFGKFIFANHSGGLFSPVRLAPNVLAPTSYNRYPRALLHPEDCRLLGRLPYYNYRAALLIFPNLVTLTVIIVAAVKRQLFFRLN